MDDNNLSERLKALAKGKNRSATARLREIFDEIETALLAGARRKDVHQALIESGFTMSFASFELAVYRIRKERTTQKNSPAPAKNSASPAPSETKTGFHKVLEQIAEQNQNEDPRRTT